MQLTNQQIADAVVALEQFNPPCSFKAKMRLNRNLRKLRSKQQDSEHDRLRLVYSNVTDKNQRPAPGQQITLSPEEHLRFMPEFEKLMDAKVDVEIHAIEIFDGSAGEKPAFNDPDSAIDTSVVELPNHILNRLIDVVFVEPGQTLGN